MFSEAAVWVEAIQFDGETLKRNGRKGRGLRKVKKIRPLNHKTHLNSVTGRNELIRWIKYIKFTEYICHLQFKSSVLLWRQTSQSQFVAKILANNLCDVYSSSPRLKVKERITIKLIGERSALSVFRTSDWLTIYENSLGSSYWSIFFVFGRHSWKAVYY